VDKRELPAPTPKVRLWRYLPILIILGLAVHLLVPQITTLTKSWSVVQKMIWWAVGLAVIAQVSSYVGSGFMLHAILKNNQEKLSTLKGILITLAAYSVGLVAGGWVGGAAATYGWVRQESRDGSAAALAGTLPPMLNNAVLAVISVIGVIHLIAIHDLSQMQLIDFGAVLLLICMVAVGVIAALRAPERISRLAVRLSSRFAKWRHKEYQPQATIASIEQFVHAWQALGNGRWLIPALGAIANISFDMLTLYFLFIAARYNISLGILFAGYGLPFMLGKIAFMFPGGLGVIEAGMVAMYVSLKVPNEVSVVVILGYRLLSFWIPTFLGFAAAAYLGGGLSKRN